MKWIDSILLPARDLSKNLFEQPLGSLFDYLKGEGVLFVEEMEEIEKEAESFSRSIDEHYEKALAKKRPVLPPDFFISRRRSSPPL